MALSVAVSEVVGKWAVRCVASSSTGTVTWWRDEAGRQTLIGTGIDIIDRSVPLNTAVSYVATDNTASVVSSSITVASSRPILSSSMYGTTYPVTIVSQQPNIWRARSRWHPVLDRTDGPVVSIFDMEWRDGNLALALADRNERSALIEMMMAGDPLILRGTCPQTVDDLTILVLEMSDPYVIDGKWDSGQQLQIHYQSVTEEPPAYVAPPSWTYADVVTSHATYNEVLGTYATYQDLLAKVPS